MGKQKIVNVTVGSVVSVGGREYQITRKQTDMGAWGDFVTLDFYDKGRGWWITDQTFKMDTKIMVIEKGAA
jgi:hypothetical protein